MFKIMSKGAWIVVGSFFVFGAFAVWTDKHALLKGNVWSEHRIMKADPIELKVDFLGLQVAQFVENSVGSILNCLLIAFVYTAIQN